MFIAGPEGTGYLTWSGSTIGHTVADLLSKNIWYVGRETGLTCPHGSPFKCFFFLADLFCTLLLPGV